MNPQRRIERLLFSRPAWYGAKRFLIEVVIWRWILEGLFRLEPNPMPDRLACFERRRVLSAACGPGFVTTGPGLSGAASVTAFDLSPQFARSCSREHADWLVYCGDLLNLPHSDGAFDLCVLYSTLHHVPGGAEPVLAELARVSRHGIVVLEGLVPARGLLRRLLLIWYRLVDGGHHYYTLDEFSQIAARVGLRVRESSHHGPIRHMWLGILEPATDGPGSPSHP